MPEKNHPQCLIQDLSLVEAFIIILLSLLFYRADKKKNTGLEPFYTQRSIQIRISILPIQ